MFKKLPKKIIIPAVIVFVVIIFIATLISKKGSTEDQDKVKPTRKPEPVNVIPVNERPYVTLKPLIPRNQLEFTIHNLPKEADSVEVTLEYDRNKGVLDAVLRQFDLEKIPFTQELFMGSKSAGGHITYHDDVIGGTLHLEFEGDDPYALEVPWRYDDTLPKYSELSTADGKFQIELEEAYKTKKVLVMQSPGLPLPLEGELLAGPYLFRGEASLPSSASISLRIRLSEESADAKLYGFNGEEWQLIQSDIDGKTLSATSDIFLTYAVVKP